MLRPAVSGSADRQRLVLRLCRVGSPVRQASLAFAPRARDSSRVSDPSLAQMRAVSLTIHVCCLVNTCLLFLSTSGDINIRNNDIANERRLIKMVIPTSSSQLSVCLPASLAVCLTDRTSESCSTRFARARKSSLMTSTPLSEQPRACENMANFSGELRRIALARGLVAVARSSPCLSPHGP